MVLTKISDIPRTPTLLRYGGDVWEEILERLAAGENLTHICKDAHMPPRCAVIRRTIREPMQFGMSYQQARLMGADVLFDDLCEIIKQHDISTDKAEVARLKILIDTIKWQLSVTNPRKYSERMLATLEAVTQPVTITLCGGDTDDKDMSNA